jgi:hypothetical protein
MPLTGSWIARGFAVTSEEDERLSERDAGEDSGDDPANHALLAIRFWLIETNAYDGRGSGALGEVRRERERGGPVDGSGHFDDSAAMREHDAFLEFELLDESGDEEGLFDGGDFTDELARDQEVLRALGVHHLDVGPGHAAQDPFIVFDSDDGGVERKLAAPDLIERRRNGQHSHETIVLLKAARQVVTMGP